MNLRNEVNKIVSEIVLTSVTTSIKNYKLDKDTNLVKECNQATDRILSLLEGSLPKEKYHMEGMGNLGDKAENGGKTWRATDPYEAAYNQCIADMRDSLK